ncbi:MAG: hypothetical protein WKF47_15175 [Geodermatophilaceae bacterium]
MATSGRAKPGYHCTECGNTSPRWLGRCTECQAWGTVVEVAGRPAGAARGHRRPR